MTIDYTFNIFVCSMANYMKNKEAAYFDLTIYIAASGLSRVTQCNSKNYDVM